MPRKVERFAYMYANLFDLERLANIELNLVRFRNKYFYQPKDLIFSLFRSQTHKQILTNSFKRTNIAIQGVWFIFSLIWLKSSKFVNVFTFFEPESEDINQLVVD